MSTLQVIAIAFLSIAIIIQSKTLTRITLKLEKTQLELRKLREDTEMSLINMRARLLHDPDAISRQSGRNAVWVDFPPQRSATGTSREASPPPRNDESPTQ